MSETTKTSLDDLVAMFEEWKYGHGKSLIVISGVTAIISMISSALLVWIILRSKDRLSTTYHRLMLGISISDFMYSFGLCTFAATSPSDLNYMVWNARGNARSCDAMGFVITTGACCGVLYMCSLNLYFLVKVKYNKSDDCIRTRIEPFLHGVPMSALLFSTLFLIRQNYNEDQMGVCHLPIYDPPHCIGYEDGQVPEGFEIPCGRGREGATFAFIMRMVILIPPQIIIGTALGSLYYFVSKQEKRSARYGGPPNSNHFQQASANSSSTDNDHGRDNRRRGMSSFTSWLSWPIKRGRHEPSSNSNRDRTCSQVVAHRALAYSMAYFITWIWPLAAAILGMAGIWNDNPLEMATWQLVYMYLWRIFNHLQGLFNFLIFMHPNVIKAKRSGNNISLFQAFFLALRSSLSGGKKNSLANDRGNKQGNNQVTGPGMNRGSGVNNNTSVTHGSTNVCTAQTEKPCAEEGKP